MRRKFVLAGVLMVAVIAAVYLLFAPTFNAPVMAQALQFEDEARLVKRLKVADGYQFNIFATSVGRARLMQETKAGNFIVTAARNGRVLLVQADRDGDGRSDGSVPLLDGLARPHGLIVEGDVVYIAETHRVSRYRLVDEDQPKKVRLVFEGTLVEDLPADGGHSTRTIIRGPDGEIYLSVGSSCNVCVEEHPWRAAVLRLAGDGQVEIFARGLRNSVGLDWQPGTGALFATNAGRDQLGGDFPREEMNLVVKGAHYGWPYVNEDNVPDPGFGDKSPEGLQFATPAHMFTAHSTPLSIRFLRYQANVVPGHVALVARHGSWNRPKKSGYDVVLLRWQADGSITEEPFISGFMIDEDVIGRPVGITETADGTVYITDDFARAIYRVVRRH